MPTNWRTLPKGTLVRLKDTETWQFDRRAQEGGVLWLTSGFAVSSMADPHDLIVAVKSLTTGLTTSFYSSVLELPK